MVFDSVFSFQKKKRRESNTQVEIDFVIIFHGCRSVDNFFLTLELVILGYSSGTSPIVVVIHLFIGDAATLILLIDVIEVVDRELLM